MNQNNNELFIDVEVNEQQEVSVDIIDSEHINVSVNELVEIRTDNYNDLKNLPKINGKEIKGDVTEEIRMLIPKIPEVPEWAIQEEPPKYTAEDVGAVPESVFQLEVENLIEGISEANKGVQDVQRDIVALNQSIGNKVDKKEGMGLSSNNFSDDYKSIVDTVPEINNTMLSIQADVGEVQEEINNFAPINSPVFFGNSKSSDSRSTRK